jgi:hypothetical protein
MGFKTCSQAEFEKAMNKFDKLNRKNKTSHREPTLAEQIADLERKNIERKEQARLEREKLNTPRFHPMYEAKLKSEKAELLRQQQLETKFNKKK